MMELAPANRELSISSALSIKCELALTFLHSLNSILPLGALQQGELEWLTEKIKVFTEEEQEAILASALSFAEHDLIVAPSINIQPKETCSQQELMYFVCSASVSYTHLHFLTGTKHEQHIGTQTTKSLLHHTILILLNHNGTFFGLLT